jgi:hypothetical protein
MPTDKQIESHRGLYASFWHDYSSFLPGMNWRNFGFIHASIEFNTMMGEVEWEFCLLGLWYRGTYVYDDNTPTRQELSQMVAEWEDRQE